MPISDQAAEIADWLMVQRNIEPGKTIGYHYQVKSEKDGKYHWMHFDCCDLDGLTRINDLQAVVQSKLIDRGFITR